MALMMLVGTSSAWAVNNVSGGYIYFDNSTTKWTDSSIQFVIGHNSYSRTYVMKKLSNSNVYYYKLDDAEYHTWGDATYYAVIGTSSKWGDGSWGSSNLSNATHRTAAYTSTYNLNSGSTYCFTPSSSSNGASLTITTSYPNTTNRAYVYAVSNGSTAATSKAAAGTVNVAGYYISSQGTTSSRSATSSASTYSASNTFVRGTTITMSVVSTGSGYTFKGWYSSSTASSGNLLGTSTTYTYTSSGSSTKTVYAVFEANPTVVISETGGTGIVQLGNTTLSTSATSMTSGTYDLSITAPTGYKVSAVSVSGGSLTTAGTTGSTTYTGKVNVSANTTINITYEQACTKNPTSDDFSFTAPNNLYYSGNNMSATVNWKNAQDKGGEISIFYSSDENTFIEATPNLPGTYYVFITAAADGDFCDLNTKTKVGSFTIKGNDLDNANIYFDNSKGKWASAPKLHIGNLGKNGAYYSMSLVSGTRYLYAKTGLTFEDYVAWFFTPHGDGGSENIQTNYNTIETKSGYNVTPIKYIDETPALTTNKIYGTNGNDGDIYNLSTPIDYSTKKLNIDISGEGTVVIKNNAGTTLYNENEYPYLTYLKSIKATPSVGYELESIKINGIDYTDAYENGANTDNGYDMVADANVTITFARSCAILSATTTEFDICRSDNDQNTAILSVTADLDVQSYTWKKGNETISGATESSYTAKAGGTYIVTATGNNGCTTNEITFTVNDLTPVVNIKDGYGDQSVCNGEEADFRIENNSGTISWVNGNNQEVGTEATFTPTITSNSNYWVKVTENGCSSFQSKVTATVLPKPAWSASATVTEICEGEEKQLKINTTNTTSLQWYNSEGEINEATEGTLMITEPETYYAILSNSNGCTNQTANFTVANAFGSDITPTITGSASVQSGAANITYSTANVDGATYVWQLPTGWTFSGDEDGNQITVSAPSTEGYGTITVNITKNDCTKTATLDVAWMNGFTVYLRRPHATNEKTQYNYWFEKSGAPEPGYVKFGEVATTPTFNQMYGYNGGISSTEKDPNEVATRGTVAFTDCDGYVWDAYNIGVDVTALYFRAPNDKATNNTYYGGWATYTWSYTQNTPIAEDMYFTIGDWPGTSQKGRELTKVDKPFDGVTIDDLGGREICSNNMASFAALYLKSNCTGQEITDYAWKFSNNNSSWGPYTTGKGVNTNNIRPNKAGYYHLECTLKDGSVVTSNSIQITTTTCPISNASLNNITSNLPIIMVNTGDKAFPSVDNGKHCSASADDLKKKRSVDVKIIWNPNGTVTSTDAYSNGANLYYDRKARMNYRGSSSLNFEKKSYAFCPGDENCGQDDDKSADYVKTKKMNMFGIGEAEDKDWVLYAAYVDPSMMRNILAMETYSAMTGKWGVKNKYVELYIDGEYQGVYVFMDKVTQNKKRVDVKWDVKDDTKRDFILKFDKTDVADRYEDASGDQKTFESDMTGKTGISTYDTKVDQRFEIEYPEKEDIMDDGGYWSDVYSFVLGKVNEFESALSKGDFTTVRSLINYESWADFFILNEFTKNIDAYRASCIFVYTGGKFEAWPLWDYELSFNNTVTGNGKGRGETTGLLIEHSDMYSDEFPAPFWWTGKYNGSNMYSGLLKDPCFVQMIKSRWAEHTKAGGPLNPSTTTAKTAAYKTILDAQGAATREFTKWPVTSRGKDACNNVNTGYFQYGGGGANTTYANSYSQLNTWLGANARIKGLQAEIDELDDIIEFGITSTVDKNETTPWRAVNVTVDAVGADYTYNISPEITKGQVIEGGSSLLIYAEPASLPQEYTVTTTLDAKDQCGSTGENPTSTVTFTVEELVDVCE